MSRTKTRKQITLWLDEKLYKYIRSLAKNENRSVNNFIEMLLAEATNFKEPNEETRRAIEEARAERPFLKQYKSADDLFDDLIN